ncbi:MAG: exo-alpha-sialidase [Limisphaerales bacterium]
MTRAVTSLLALIAFGVQAAWLDQRLTALPTDKLGPFAHTSDGAVIAIDGEATFVSRDDGKTWSDPRPLKGALEKGIKVSRERALLRTKDGSLIAAFMNLNERKWTWDNKLHDAPGAKLPTWAMRSTDDGKTWGHVQKLHENWSGAVRDMIQTKSGQIIFTAMKMMNNPGRHTVLTYSSNDDGKTWQASNLIDLGGRGHHGGVTEPTIVELKDGRLWLLIRTNWGEFWSAYSNDAGLTWKDIKTSGIPASSAPGMLQRLQSGRLVLLWNRPYPEGKTEWPLTGGDGLWSDTPVSNHREELSIAWSTDEGKTWSQPEVIVHQRDVKGRGSQRWASYPYLFEHQPGQLWLTTMQGGIRAEFRERDFVERTIVAFGDSTTARRGPLKIYSGLLAKANPKDRVINAGIGGHNTDHARKRFQKDVLSKNPDLVIIQFGINDAAVDVWKKATKPRVSIERYEKNLKFFVATLKGRKAKVILMTPNPIRWTEKLKRMYGKPPYRGNDPDGFNVLLRDYAQVVRKVATDNRIPLIDVYRTFDEAKDIDSLLLDGMHPNNRGHQIVADKLQRELAR